MSTHRILFTRMYGGEYLDVNIGHEAINLLKDDNDKNYIYITKTARMSKKYEHSKIVHIFLMAWEEIGVMRVVARADGVQFEGLEKLVDFTKRDTENHLKNLEYIKDNQITYGGVSLDKIYPANPINMQTSSFLTYKAENVIFPKNDLFICTKKSNELKNSIFIGSKINFPTQSMHWDYDEYDYSEQFKILKNAIKNDAYWQSENRTKKIPLDFEPNVFYEENLAPNAKNFQSKYRENFKDINLGFLNRIVSLKK